MSFCPNCGNEVAEGIRFCSHCGHGIQNHTPVTKPVRAAGGRRLHCPSCGSNALSAIVETDVTGGMALNHSFSRKNSVSTMEFNNTHRNYWMCGDCGHKFRNLQNLEEEIAKMKNLVLRGIIGIALLAVLAVLFSVVGGSAMPLVFMIPVILLVAAAVVYFKNKTSKLGAEWVHLKKHCFN